MLCKLARLSNVCHCEPGEEAVSTTMGRKEREEKAVRA